MKRNSQSGFNKITTSVIATVLLTVICGSCFSTLQADETRYSVGVVPQFHAREIERIWKPILKMVGNLSGVTLELSASPNIPEFEKQFEMGKYHFAYMNPYHALVANRTQGYQPLVRDVSKELKGIIVVRKDSPITKVEQLDGKKVAMPAPNALGAALLPRAEFANIFKIKPDISYVKSHDSVYMNVALGLAEAGGGVMATFKKQSPTVRDKLRITYKTQGVAAHPFVAHPDVPSEVVRRIQDAFLQLGQSEQGKALLAKIPMKQVGATSLQDYEPLIKLGLDEFYVKK